MRLVIATICLMVSTAGSAQWVPQISGQPATAAEMNNNLQALQDLAEAGDAAVAAQGAAALAVIETALGLTVGAFEVTAVFTSGPGVAGVVCPAETLPISAQCSCSQDDPAIQNLGVMFACENVVDGALVGCFIEAGDVIANGFLGQPTANVTTMCFNLIQQNGNPFVIEPFAKAQGLAKPTGEQKTVEDKMIEYQNLVSRQQNNLQQ